MPEDVPVPLELLVPLELVAPEVPLFVLLLEPGAPTELVLFVALLLELDLMLGELG